MVGNQQGTRCSVRQISLDLDAQRIKQGDRPA